MTHYAYSTEDMGPYKVDPLKHIGLAMMLARRFPCPRLERQDIEQEAIAALCTAARTFDPDKGVFSTWAGMLIVYHLKAVTLQYRRIGSVGGRRSRFATKKLRQHVREGGSTDLNVVRPLLVNRWWVKPTDWDCFVALDSIINQEISLNQTTNRAGDDNSPSSASTLLDFIEDDESLVAVTRGLETQDYQRLVNEALDKMRPHERDVALRRVLEFFDDPLTLQQIGDDWGVSRERVRQIEEKARDVLTKKLADELL